MEKGYGFLCVSKSVSNNTHRFFSLKYGKSLGSTNSFVSVVIET